MNFKKFISGVGAFAIAASAFAGMAVTASAAETASYGDDSWTISTNGTGFTGDYTDKSSTTKTAVGVKGNGGSGNRAAYFAPTQTTKTKVTVDAYVVLESGNNNSSVTYYKLEDQAGNVLVRLGLDGNNVTNVTLQDSTGVVAENVIPAAKAKDSVIGNGSSAYGLTAWTEVKAVLYFSRGTGVVTIGSTDYNITLNSDSTAFKQFYIQAGRGYGACLVSDYSITEEDDVQPAGALTIKYVDGTGNTLKTSTSPNVSALNAGDSYKYTYSKYIANGGNLYKTTADKTNATAILRTTAVEENVVYAVEAEGTYYFYELDGGYTTRADYESNGSAATDIATVTVPADGVYTVTANCYGSAANRTGTVKVGENVIVGDTSISIYAPGTNLTATGVALHEGDIITVDVSDSKSGIDYVILQKTGDLPTPASASAVTADDTFTTDEGDSAATYRFTVTPNDETVTSITVTAAGSNETSRTISTPTLSGDGSIYCAIIATYKTSAPDASAFSVSIN